MSTETPDSNAALNTKASDFESSLKHLKDLVTELEDGSLSLEESLRIFKEASQLATNCEQQLASVEEQVRIITQGAQ